MVDSGSLRCEPLWGDLDDIPERSKNCKKKNYERGAYAVRQLYIMHLLQHRTCVDHVELAWTRHDPIVLSIRLVSQTLLCYNTTMTMFFDNLKILKNLVFGTNDGPLLAIQPHRDQEDQEVTIHNEQVIGHQVAEMDNAHVRKKSKASFSRDTSNTDSSPPKGSLRAPQENPKPDARTRNGRLPTNTCSQCGTAAKENAVLNTQLEAGRDDLVKAIKQSKELESKNQALVGEKEDLLASANIEKERVCREQIETKKQIRDLQGKNQKLEEELNILKGTLRGVQDKHLHTVKLLEERTADLKGAQTFLTTVDRYAGADIMKMVEALNAEIFQGAALVSELLGDENAFEVDERKKNARGERNLTQYIGPKLTEHLSTKSKQVQLDPFPLQLAVQQVLTSWCVFMVNSFYPSSARDDLKEIYGRIWESGRHSCTKSA